MLYVQHTMTSFDLGGFATGKEKNRPAYPSRHLGYKVFPTTLGYLFLDWFQTHIQMY